MKRKHDSKNNTVDYLEIDDLNDASMPNKPKSKAEVKEQRLQENKLWKNKTRKLWSEEDPNPRHTLYYKAQLPDLISEWDEFQRTILKPLPVTFRTGHSCPPIFRDVFPEFMNSFSTKGKFIVVEEQVLQGSLITPLEWIDQTWTLGCDSNCLAKTSDLTTLHSFLQNAADVNHIIRQEAVSMIPAEVLGIQPHHRVLDMCAAPGSKSSQVLDIMMKNSPWGEFPTGVLIANDADPKRLETLKKRLQYGHPSLLITCSRAEDISSTLQHHHFLMDRIICDVPCTGDGTFRKCPHLWRLFRSRMGMEMHNIQLQIAMSGVHALKPGGRMVYSTCSLNPLEDEAVVAALLRSFPESLRLINIRGEGLLPKLKSRLGISRWRSDIDVFLSGELNEKDKKQSLSKLPPITDSMNSPSDVEIAQFHLDYCLRIMPHDQNTGGFFIALLEKLPSVSVANPITTTASSMAPYEGDGTMNDLVSRQQALSSMKKLGYNPKLKKEISVDSLSSITREELKVSSLACLNPNSELSLFISSDSMATNATQSMNSLVLGCSSSLKELISLEKVYEISSQCGLQLGTQSVVGGLLPFANPLTSYMSHLGYFRSIKIPWTAFLEMLSKIATDNNVEIVYLCDSSMDTSNIKEYVCQVDNLHDQLKDGHVNRYLYLSIEEQSLDCGNKGCDDVSEKDTQFKKHLSKKERKQMKNGKAVSSNPIHATTVTANATTNATTNATANATTNATTNATRTGDSTHPSFLTNFSGCSLLMEIILSAGSSMEQPMFCLKVINTPSFCHELWMVLKFIATNVSMKKR